MNTGFEELPMADLNATRAASHISRAGRIASRETVRQDLDDSEKIMGHLGLDMSLADKIEAGERYLIETIPDAAGNHSSGMTGSGIVREGRRKPHYTHLFDFGDRMIFQAACCLPLRVIAASLDCKLVFGRVMYSCHSGDKGGKLIYEIQGRGSELIIDLKRGDSTRAQRLIYRI